jgi:hypothetical protein
VLAQFGDARSTHPPHLRRLEALPRGNDLTAECAKLVDELLLLAQILLGQIHSIPV